jgi:hypothetical protein
MPSGPPVPGGTGGIVSTGRFQPCALLQAPPHHAFDPAQALKMLWVRVTGERPATHV